MFQPFFPLNYKFIPTFLKIFRHLFSLSFAPFLHINLKFLFLLWNIFSFFAFYSFPRSFLSHRLLNLIPFFYPSSSFILHILFFLFLLVFFNFFTSSFLLDWLFLFFTFFSFPLVLLLLIPFRRFLYPFLFCLLNSTRFLFSSLHTSIILFKLHFLNSRYCNLAP